MRHPKRDYSQWLRVACLVAGVTGPILRSDARALAEMLVATERLIPAAKYVDWMVERGELAALEGLF